MKFELTLMFAIAYCMAGAFVVHTTVGHCESHGVLYSKVDWKLQGYCNVSGLDVPAKMIGGGEYGSDKK